MFVAVVICMRLLVNFDPAPCCCQFIHAHHDLMVQYAWPECICGDERAPCLWLHKWLLSTHEAHCCLQTLPGMHAACECTPRSSSSF